MIRKSLFAASALAILAGAAPAPRTETAVFAGGCFWSTETDLQRVPGIVSTTTGYIGGHVARPSYEDVSTGQTGHREAVKVVYDPTKLSYAKLLDAYWHTIDPTDAGGTFCDRGEEYKSAVFAMTPEQMKVAQASKAIVAAMPRFKGKPIATEIKGAMPFYAAEGYHQNYHSTHPLQYGAYRIGCGRDASLRRVWGVSPADAHRG